jgi:hypothetical protein
MTQAERVALRDATALMRASLEIFAKAVDQIEALVTDDEPEEIPQGQRRRGRPRLAVSQ